MTSIQAEIKVYPHLTYEMRHTIKLQLDTYKRMSPATFDGVCLYCLEEIPVERYAHGGTPKFCCDSHRKKFGRRRR